MKRKLDGNSDDTPVKRLGATRVFVRELPYANSAAKFWSTMMDEALDEFPQCDEIVLQADTGGLLGPQFLTPELALQRDMENMQTVNMREAFAEVMAAMEILGPPCGVLLTLRFQNGTLDSREMPLDCIDAEILPFLLVWLLEWSNLTEFAWNRDQVRGEFRAEDRERSLAYHCSFTLANRHLSEGLFRRELALRFQRRDLARVSGGAA